MKTLIVIPARYGSTRFPGKPLAKIAGKEMLLRVWENAQKAASKFEGCQAVVATDDERIMDFCRSRGNDFRQLSDGNRPGHRSGGKNAGNAGVRGQSARRQSDLSDLVC